MILGIDASTSVVGWSVFDLSGALIDYGYIDIKGAVKKNKLIALENKVDYTLEKLEPLFEKHLNKITSICIEEAAQRFRRGKSTAHTLNLLLSFNFALRYVIYKRTGKLVQEIPVTTARKLCGIVVPKIKGKNASKQKKEFVRQAIAVKYPQVQWKISKFGNISPENFDVADAIVIAEAGYAQSRKTTLTTSRSLRRPSSKRSFGRGVSVLPKRLPRNKKKTSG